MKAYLLYRARDFDAEREPPPGEQALRDDLALDLLLGAMAQGDEFLFEIARKALLQSLTDPQEIAYRQEALRDCLAHPEVTRELYEVAIEAIGSERRVYMGFFSRSPSMILYRSVQVLELLLKSLRRLRALAEEHDAEFRSQAFRRFFAMVRSSSTTPTWRASKSTCAAFASTKASRSRHASAPATGAPTTRSFPHPSQRACWPGSPRSPNAPTATPTAFPIATRPAPGRSGSCATEASTSSPTRPARPPNTSLTSSASYAPSSPSTSAA